MVFARLRAGLSRTRNKIRHAMRTLGGDQTTAETLEALEEILYTADVGPLAGELLEAAEAELKAGRLAQPGEIQDWLHAQLLQAVIGPGADPIPLVESGPTVVLVVGVNGAGKTTSIAKLVHLLQKQGRKVLVAAGDTFRAAAVEQLTIWCDRLGADLIKSQQGADPAAVAHDGAEAAIARNADVLIVDTAGRLHTQKNLMSELEKISRVLGRKIDAAPHHTLLVLDATTGQNAVQQARQFGECVPLSGVILSKLDGTAKGGAVVSIGRQLGLPVCYVGLGEQIDDFEVFNPSEFLEALFATKD
jgi:fused signal recognition particle receptor